MAEVSSKNPELKVGFCVQLIPASDEQPSDLFLVTKIAASNKFEGALLSTGEQCSLVFICNNQGNVHVNRKDVGVLHFQGVSDPVAREIVEYHVTMKESGLKQAAALAASIARRFPENSKKFFEMWDTAPGP